LGAKISRGFNWDSLQVFIAGVSTADQTSSATIAPKLFLNP
jgi:hypothetical protein